MLPLHVYSDPSIFEKELEILFRDGPGYVGHEQVIPNIGDYHTIESDHHGRMLIHTHTSISLISNICRHKQAIMYHGDGNTRAITCPLHKWTWDLQWAMIGAPHFQENPCMNLRQWPLQNWRGLLFAGKRNISEDLKDIGFGSDIDFSEFRYHHTEKHTCHYNWKSFMEVYGDDYHVAPYHPGLSKMVTLKDLEVITGENWHIQTVWPAEILNTKTTPIYDAWRAKCLEKGDGKLPRYGAIWFAYYPNIMIEVYPYTITVSTLHPISPSETMNTIEFFYHHDVDEALIEAEQAAYMETAIEDDDIAERMDQGRALLRDHEKDWWYTPDETSGPCHPTLEKGTEHFMEWWKRSIWY